jgi:hypothetical protein
MRSGSSSGASSVARAGDDAAVAIAHDAIAQQIAEK